MNVNNNAIKRIMADVRELAKHPSPRYSAAPLEDNVFEWHFSIRGPKGTDFEGDLLDCLQRHVYHILKAKMPLVFHDV